ncbi:DUF2544 domain-containing protein [Escherichia albertii]|uniref:StfH/YfcO family fimbrial adhesin n=2 Tax=Escherichia albertii TaxID=208962 RepID=UPI0007438FCE|nr:StfH/YfcO family fimbrial adhesin [Escherichia albertii]EFB1499146.1 DUF2544 domain-containing protein [Escherichia albertii]MCU7309455.1 StfH/YfcO family fimbrial adhesin [Escherichia albertii]MCZ8669193.1 StfH/YfcO family fimbrial adhesin [Escherichia albertii]MCZ8674986.1 StfH/YfcO family fimbrial adhesin [Escherichia albertii]WDB53730.1 StfH/YfcO family fimbrial adhesin [Escherichia albertii]
MKKKFCFLCLLGLFFLSTGVQSKQELAQLVTVMGYAGYNGNPVYNLDLLTTTGTMHGEYVPTSHLVKVEDLVLRSWQGGGTPPTLHLDYAHDLGTTVPCPGLPEFDARTQDSWTCYEVQVTVSVDQSPAGCPWLVSTHIDTTVAADGTYVAPTKVQSKCSAVPLDTYDVSWDESKVVRDKRLQLQSTGGMIENILPTYLMEGGRLCDVNGSDSHATWCRMVSQMLTFTSSGCDDAKVTVTPNRYPVTENKLHDMIVHVDTSSMQPFDSTCRFTYVLNMI